MSINAETIGYVLASSASVVFIITALFTISDLTKKNKKQEEILNKIKHQDSQLSFEFDKEKRVFQEV